MSTTHSLTVSEEHNQLRLDVFLTHILKDVPSRTFLKKVIEGGYVSVNELPVKAHHKVKTGDEIFVEIPDDFFEPQNLTPENIPLDVFYEDEFLLVINKPSGMMVHPATGCYTGTLVNALLYRQKNLSDVNTSLRPGIVHRLDKETSGLMIVAKDNRTHAKLAEQFQDHEVKKKYIALVEGEVNFDEGTINAPIGRDLYQREKKKVSFDESAREATTRYQAIKRWKGITFIALFPKTGRTHQLRVHMAYLKHPILGDEKYGHKQTFPRLALHAQAISFIHPGFKRFVEFSSIPPQEFLQKAGIETV